MKEAVKKHRLMPAERRRRALEAKRRYWHESAAQRRLSVNAISPETIRRARENLVHTGVSLEEFLSQLVDQIADGRLQVVKGF